MDVVQFLGGIVDTLCKSLEEECMQLVKGDKKLYKAVKETGLFYSSRSSDGRRLQRRKTKYEKQKIVNQLRREQIKVQNFKRKQSSILELKKELVEQKKQVVSSKRSNKRYLFIVSVLRVN